jgi:pyridoxal 5'-phosphate synthase pdxT subunit
VSLSKPGSAPTVTIGVLALQGAFAAHVEAFADLGIEAVEVRTATQLSAVDALVMPGGESTTMSKLLETFELFEPLAARLRAGFPVFGTCAGMILLASDVLDGRPDQRSFAVIDMAVRRNGYGRQVDSFETDLHIEGIESGDLHAVFIRAPLVERVGRSVDVLADVDGHPVVCRSGNVLVAAFHPELTTDRRLHAYFLSNVVQSAVVQPAVVQQ